MSSEIWENHIKWNNLEYQLSTSLLLSYFELNSQFRRLQTRSHHYQCEHIPCSSNKGVLSPLVCHLFIFTNNIRSQNIKR